eukprot:scaffold159078_cov15-Tisochrysis_lutea.AAC.2
MPYARMHGCSASRLQHYSHHAHCVGGVLGTPTNAITATALRRAGAADGRWQGWPAGSAGRLPCQ